MKRLVTPLMMKAFDTRTIRQMGMPPMVLMERAALAVVERVKAYFEGKSCQDPSLNREKPGICVLCGSGNNGGDGLAVARILFLSGYNACFYLAGDLSHASEQFLEQLQIAENYQVPQRKEAVFSYDEILIDAIFGIGLSRPLDLHTLEIIKVVNSCSAFRIAVDVPSGVNCLTGQVWDSAFLADETVTFGYGKAGLLLYPARHYTGKVTVADVGIYEPEEEKKEKSGEEPFSDIFSLEENDLSWLNERKQDGNKSTFGKVLVVAGQAGMCGAACLCAKAVLRTGAGMVKISTSEDNRIPLQTLLPEAMVSCSHETKTFSDDLAWCDVLVIGPGLGQGETSRIRAEWFLSHAAEQKKPFVLDADGLNLLSGHKAWRAYLHEKCILTPHMGEMSRLTGIETAVLKKNPVSEAAAFSKELGATIVMKDASTVIASPDGKLFINSSGNAGMATAGSGDVLSGVLGGILAQTRNFKNPISTAYLAACGVFLHGISGDLAAKRLGQPSVMAHDIIDELGNAIAGNYRKEG